MIATISPALHSAAHLVTVRVIQSLLDGSLIGLFAATALRFSRHNAGTRFAVWFFSVMAIAVIPAITGEWVWRASSASQAHAALTLPDSWALYCFAIWAAVSVWFLIGVARSVAHLRRLRKSCPEIDMTTLDPALQETIRRQQKMRKVVLCTSSTVQVPTAIGLVNPAVVIPDWVMRELSTREVNQILLHEFAHLLRWDDWTNLAVQIVKAIFFFHPVVWWIEREVALEREMACDDAVLAQTENPRSYAECLAHLAEKSFLQRTVVLAHAALGRIRQTTQRVARILESDSGQHQTRVLKPVVSLVAVFAVGCGLWGARASRLIAFRGSPVDQSARDTVAYSQSSSARSLGNAKIIPAMARSSQPLGITQTQFKAGSFATKRSSKAATEHRGTALPRRSNDVVQLKSMRAIPLPVTETIFVLIPNAAPDSEAGQLYQIQMWHVMVLRTIVSPAATQISHQEI